MTSLETFTQAQGAVITITRTPPANPSGTAGELVAELVMQSYTGSTTHAPCTPAFALYNIGPTGLPDTDAPDSGPNQDYNSELMLADSLDNIVQARKKVLGGDGTTIPLVGLSMTDTVIKFTIQYDPTATTPLQFQFRICIWLTDLPQDNQLPMLFSLSLAPGDEVANWSGLFGFDQNEAKSNSTRMLTVNAFGGTTTSDIDWTHGKN